MLMEPLTTIISSKSNSTEFNYVFYDLKKCSYRDKKPLYVYILNIHKKYLTAESISKKISTQVFIVNNCSTFI